MINIRTIFKVKITVLLLFVCQFGYSQKLQEMFSLKQGKYKVGFTIIHEKDQSRVNKGKSRALNIAVWYPTKSKATNYLKYQDYLVLRATEDSVGKVTPSQRLKDAFLNYFKKDVSKRNGRVSFLDSLYQFDVASIDAPTPLVGNHPILIYFAGFENPSFENSVMFEYLASHGYVVYSLPSNGVGARMTYDKEGLNAQVQDVAWLFNYVKVKRNKYTKSKKTGLIGFSWGGLASAIALNKGVGVDAFISLDGSFSYVMNTPKEILPNFGTTDVNVPSLCLLPWGDHQDFAFVRTLKDVHIFKLQNIGHRNLTSDAILLKDIPGSKEMQTFYKQKKAGLKEGYSFVCKVSKAFLDIKLKGDATFLKLQKKTLRKKKYAFDYLLFNPRKSKVKDRLMGLLKKKRHLQAVNNYYQFKTLFETPLKLDAKKLTDYAFALVKTGDPYQIRLASSLLWIGMMENPKSADFNYYLAKYYLSDNIPSNDNGATRYLNAALKINPQHKDALLLKKKITK